MRTRPWPSFCFRTSGSAWRSCEYVGGGRRNVGQTHGDCRHLPNDLRIDAVIQTSHAAGRERMGQQKQVALLQFTPRTGISVAQLDEVDGAVVFRAPAKRLDFADALIDLNERAGPEHGIERVVVQADIAVQTVADVQVLNQRDGHFSPDFHHAGEQVRIGQVKGPVKPHGEGDSSLIVVHFDGRQMRVAERGVHLVETDSVEVHAEQVEQVRKADVVDGAEAEELEDAGDGIRVFNLREPGVGNGEFRIALLVADFLAQVGHVARRDSQAKTNLFELLSWARRTHIKAWYPRRGAIVKRFGREAGKDRVKQLMSYKLRQNQGRKLDARVRSRARPKRQGAFRGRSLRNACARSTFARAT